MDLPNSSDHTKEDPINAKLLTRLLLVPSFVVANKFCLNKQHFFPFLCKVRITATQSVIDLKLNLFEV